MRSVYLETSGIGRALIHGDTEALAVFERLRAGGERLFTSALTLAEVNRALLSARRKGLIDAEAEHSTRRAWGSTELHVVEITAAVLARAGQRFEVEPVRTLDAIHLATLLTWEGHIRGETAVFTRDDRVRDNALAYGVDVL